MPADYPAGNPCHFCPAPAAGQWFVTSTAPSTDTSTRRYFADTVPLCPAHHVALAQAAGVGRIQRTTGHRWWLGSGGDNFWSELERLNPKAGGL